MSAGPTGCSRRETFAKAFSSKEKPWKKNNGKNNGKNMGKNMKKMPRYGRKPDEGSLSGAAMRHLFWSLEIREVERVKKTANIEKICSKLAYTN